VAADLVDFPTNRCNFLHKTSLISYGVTICIIDCQCSWVQFFTGRRPMRSFVPGQSPPLPYGSRRPWVRPFLHAKPACPTYKQTHRQTDHEMGGTRSNTSHLCTMHAMRPYTHKCRQRNKNNSEKFQWELLHSAVEQITTL